MVYLLIVAFIVVAIIDSRTIINKKLESKTLFIYSFLLVVGFTINLLVVIDKAPTSPAVLIESLIKLILRSIR